MSNLTVKRLQLGSSTAANNFVIQQAESPNGTMIIANGNIGATTPLITINNAGVISITGSMTVGGQPVLTGVNSPFLGTNSIIRTNSTTINENITIPSGTNGMTAGPVTIASGRTVTVNGDWSVV